ncbi:PREDICTED: uncharacterized protein CXorf67-like [Elephantulus edwardii]|uniref:uncharacterized protein CXorf67-like n=1 Tax=Elephantulus edwardii TaxID=28737 RepID=UPI0003F09165|nr:PREDICTED: uncharacterized protein CXorf67-like [Elephantulus edwardii]
MEREVPGEAKNVVTSANSDDARGTCSGESVAQFPSALSDPSPLDSQASRMELWSPADATVSVAVENPGAQSLSLVQVTSASDLGGGLTAPMDLTCMVDTRDLDAPFWSSDSKVIPTRAVGPDGGRGIQNKNPEGNWDKEPAPPPVAQPGPALRSLATPPGCTSNSRASTADLASFSLQSGSSYDRSSQGLGTSTPSGRVPSLGRPTPSQPALRRGPADPPWSTRRRPALAARTSLGRIVMQRSSSSPDRAVLCLVPFSESPICKNASSSSGAYSFLFSKESDGSLSSSPLRSLGPSPSSSTDGLSDQNSSSFSPGHLGGRVLCSPPSRVRRSLLPEFNENPPASAEEQAELRSSSAPHCQACEPPGSPEESILTPCTDELPVQ